MLFTEFNLEDAKQVWLEEGIEIGVDKGKLETAYAMFMDGDSLEKIARNTKWPIETLKEKLRVQ